MNGLAGSDPVSTEQQQRGREVYPGCLSSGRGARHCPACPVREPGLLQKPGLTATSLKVAHEEGGTGCPPARVHPQARTGVDLGEAHLNFVETHQMWMSRGWRLGNHSASGCKEAHKGGIPRKPRAGCTGRGQAFPCIAASRLVL